jgi:PAS domain S-box-containing protein
MDANFWIILFVGLFSLISGVLLIDRSILAKDYSLFARVIPRIYLFIASTLYCAFYQTDSQLEMYVVHLGFLFVLLADSFIAVLFLMGKKYRDTVITKQLIEILEMTHNKYAAVIENSQVGFFIVDEKGRLEFVNKALLELLGYTLYDLINKPARDFIAPDSRELAKENMRRKFSGEVQTTCYEMNLITKSGRIIPARIASYRTDNGHPTITGSIVPLTVEAQCLPYPLQEE